MITQSILWRRLESPGHESALLTEQGDHILLRGTAVFEHQAHGSRLDYMIRCDPNWETRQVRVAGWVGGQLVDIQMVADDERRWRLHGVEWTEVQGALDVDLQFSPATNLLPIRRLDLKVGESAVVRAAWLQFPAFTLEALDQVYRRVDETIYQYEAGDGSFTAELLVNDAGFVTHYPGGWLAEAER